MGRDERLGTRTFGNFAKFRRTSVGSRSDAGFETMLNHGLRKRAFVNKKVCAAREFMNVFTWPRVATECDDLAFGFDTESVATCYLGRNMINLKGRHPQIGVVMNDAGLIFPNDRPDGLYV